MKSVSILEKLHFALLQKQQPNMVCYEAEVEPQDYYQPFQDRAGGS